MLKERDKEISPNEFGPRDVYMLDVFDKNVQRPQECIDDNPDLPYCQIMGKFIFELESELYSSITPYAHMNERCPSQGEVHSCSDDIDAESHLKYI